MFGKKRVEGKAQGVPLPEPAHCGVKSNPLGFYKDIFVKVASMTSHLTIFFYFITLKYLGNAVKVFISFLALGSLKY